MLVTDMSLTCLYILFMTIIQLLGNKATAINPQVMQCNLSENVFLIKPFKQFTQYRLIWKKFKQKKKSKVILDT